MEVKNREVVLDSVLLLLLTLGSYEPRTFRSLKRFAAFEIEDLISLRSFVQKRKIKITPHLVTEVCSLANQLPEEVRTGYFRYLAKTVSGFTETSLPSADLVSKEPFIRFGITDTMLFALIHNSTVVTEDGRLRAFLHRRAFNAWSLADIKADSVSRERR